MKIQIAVPGAVRERRSMMRSRSIFTAALVVAVLGSAVVSSATNPRFTRHDAVATVADSGQSVQSDGDGKYDTDVTISDSTDDSASDSFVLWADAKQSDRVLHLYIADVVNTDCHSGNIRIFSETDWFNLAAGKATLGEATLFCDSGPGEPAYFITWGLCVDITSLGSGGYNFRPRATCIAKVNEFRAGRPQMQPPTHPAFELPVPFDITASVP